MPPLVRGEQYPHVEIRLNVAETNSVVEQIQMVQLERFSGFFLSWVSFSLAKKMGIVL